MSVAQLLPLRFAQPQLEAWLDAALAAQAAGKTIVEVEAGDTRTRKQIEVNVYARIRDLQWALHRMGAISSVTGAVYPAPVTRTTPRYLWP